MLSFLHAPDCRLSLTAFSEAKRMNYCMMGAKMINKLLLPTFIFATLLMMKSCSDDHTITAQESATPTPTATATAKPMASASPTPKLTWSTGGQTLFLTHCGCHDVLKNSLDEVNQKKTVIISLINSTNSALVMPKPSSVKSSWTTDKSKMLEYLSSSVIE